MRRHNLAAAAAILLAGATPIGAAFGQQASSAPGVHATHHKAKRRASRRVSSRAVGIVPGASARVAPAGAAVRGTGTAAPTLAPLSPNYGTGAGGTGVGAASPVPGTAAGGTSAAVSR